VVVVVVVEDITEVVAVVVEKSKEGLAGVV
jgi:hypothetical protein